MQASAAQAKPLAQHGHKTRSSARLAEPAAPAPLQPQASTPVPEKMVSAPSPQAEDILPQLNHTDASPSAARPVDLGPQSSVTASAPLLSTQCPVAPQDAGGDGQMIQDVSEHHDAPLDLGETEQIAPMELVAELQPPDTAASERPFNKDDKALPISIANAIDPQAVISDPGASLEAYDRKPNDLENDTDFPWARSLRLKLRQGERPKRPDECDGPVTLDNWVHYQEVVVEVRV